MATDPDFTDLDFSEENIHTVWDHIQQRLHELGTVKQQELAEDTAEATDTYPAKSLRKAVLPAMATALQDQGYITVEVTDEAEKRERIKEKYWRLN